MKQLQAWARDLGFAHVGVADIDLSTAEPGLQAWLAAGFHGSMDYMARHGLKRARPAELVPGTVSVITARMDYLPQQVGDDWVAVSWQRAGDATQGVVSRYAHGRDYHKVLRNRLQRLAEQMAQAVGPLGFRVFTDSAPVLECELAARSGQGWRGKHTLVLNRTGGSMFFLGEIYIDVALAPSEPTSAHCGQCTACIDVCPTGAIVAPYRVDARRCISYLTIEHQGPIPLELRSLMGNHIYGCDDCQLACPWNKFARTSALPDFAAREPWPHARLLDLWAWDEAAFLRHTEGSAIRRIGFARWSRNVAVAMGNALRTPDLSLEARQAMQAALAERWAEASETLREHIDWALKAREATRSATKSTDLRLL